MKQRTISQRVRLSLALLAGLPLVVASCTREPAVRAPNVLLIVVDTLRQDVLPEYGFPMPTSGDMASFFADAVRFERAYATCSWTKPSVASIWTGLMPSRHRTEDVEGKQLAASLDLLPEVLSRNGYKTAALSHNINIAPGTGFAQGLDFFGYLEGGVLSYPDISEMIGEATTLLRRSDDSPTFLYLQPMNVHGPYKVPLERQRDLLGRDPGRAFAYQGPLHRAVMEIDVKYRANVTEEMVVSLRERYVTAVRYTMDQLARLIADLRQRGRYDETLIILTSDHGEELYDHRGFSHGFTLFEEVVRVPLFVKLPRGEHAGDVVEAPVSLVDLYPTVLDLLGLAVPEGLDGRSLLRQIRRRTEADEAREVLFEVDVEKRCVGRGLVLGQDKLIQIEHDYEGRSNATLLYQLLSDRGEKHSLTSERPDLAARLGELLAARFTDLAARAVDHSGELPADVDREALKALGYL